MVGLLFQTLVAARSFGFVTPLPVTSGETPFARTMQNLSKNTGLPQNKNREVLRATSNVAASSSSDQRGSLVKMAKPFSAYSYYKEAKGISSNYSKKGVASKAIKQTKCPFCVRML